MGLPRRFAAWGWGKGAAVVAGVAAFAVLGGCASPGLPRPPSLQLPAIVDDLAATRRGDVVELRFTLPDRTTDDLALKSRTLQVKLCRALDAGPCQPVAGVVQTFPAPPAGHPVSAELRDALPQALTSGAPRLLTYRVELSNSRGGSGGYSQPAFAASGSAPAAVTGLSAQGSRLGVVLAWAGPGQREERVVLRREDLRPTVAAPKPLPPKSRSMPGQGRHAAKRESVTPGVVLLDAHSEAGSATLDDTAAVDVPYRYSAERKHSVEAGGKTLEMSSEASAPVPFTLRDVFPPPVPQGLSAAGYVSPVSGGQAETFAVDLIWQPVDDLHLAGYNVYRDAAGVRVKLNATFVTVPAFHDASASAGKPYVYRVTAVDGKGNESAAATVMLGTE